MLGIVGIGVVGSAMKLFLERHRVVVAYDKFQPSDSFESLLQTKILFLCLPTTETDDGYDTSSIIATMDLLEEKKYEGLIVLRSTVLPGTTKRLNQNYSFDVAYWPEFLTAKTAVADFAQPRFIVLASDIGDTKLTELVSGLWPNVSVTVTDTQTAELFKVSVNSFYATKVQFFTELYFLCQKIDLRFETVRQLFLNTNWINKMHTLQPGPDSKTSFGGTCLPKDTNALRIFMENHDSPNAVVSGVVSERVATRM